MPADALSTEAAWSECESVIRGFEDAWHDDRRPDLGSYLPTDGPHRTQLLVELVHVELELRLRRGEPARVEDYLERFPELGDRGLTLDVVRAEYALRARHTPPVWPEELWLRFPHLVDDLRPLATDTGPPGSNTATGGRRAAVPVGVPIIPGYDVLGELGRGGMGVVYRARNRALNRVVAVKTFGVLPGADARARFAREAEAIARLDHPHIVPVYEVGEWGDGVPFFAMKFYPGGLDAVPAGPGTDPRAHARDVVAVARAVHHAHQRGVLHRDLKPSNILTDEAGRPAVADFGLAGRFDPDDPATRTAAVVGTPAFMAPEQAKDPKAVTTAADVYGLGAILYQRLTGRPPFLADTPLSTLHLAATVAPTRPAAVNPAVPRDLETVCLKCLEKDPARRYATAADLADDLDRWLDGRPVLARPVPGWVHAWRWVRRHPVGSGLGAVAAAAVVLSVVTLAVSNARIREKEGEATAAANREHAARCELEKALRDEQQALSRARLAAAARLVAAGQLPEAWRRLDECLPQHRGWEWQVLDAVRSGVPGAGVRILAEVGGGTGLALSPDGRRLAIPTAAGVTLLDAKSGQEQGRLAGAGAVAFHPDGRRLVVGRPDGGVMLWDIESGSSVWARSGGPVSRLAVSPTGERVAAAVAGRVELWAADGPPAGGFDVPGGAGSALSFSPDGDRLIAAGSAGVVNWDVAAGLPVPWTLPGASAVAYSRDGDWLVTADIDGVVRLRRVTDAEAVRAFAEAPPGLTALAFSPDGTRLVGGGPDGAVRVWEVGTGHELMTLPGAGGPVAALTWGPGDRLYSLSGGAVRVWAAR